MLLSRFLAKSPLHRESRQSGNDKDDQVKTVDVRRSHGIYPRTEANPRKPQLGDHLMKVAQLAIASNGVSNFQKERNPF